MKSLWLGLVATLACAGQAGFSEDQDPRLLTERARLEQREGRYADAVVLYKRALAIQESTLGPDHPKVAKTLSELGKTGFKIDVATGHEVPIAVNLAMNDHFAAT